MTRFLDILTGVNLHYRPSVRIFRPVVATTLMLWLSGVLCVSVCGHHLQNALAASKSRASSATSMPAGAMAQHACCRARMKNSGSALSAVAAGDSADMSCPYQRPSAEASRKFRATLSSTVAVVPIVLPPPVFVAAEEPLVERFRLPDRGGTHLRHCVFLI